LPKLLNTVIRRSSPSKNVFSARRAAATRTSPDAPNIASIVAALGVVGGSALIWFFCQRKTPCNHIVRGYFSLGDHEDVVHVTSNADFLLHIWARNVETSLGGVQITTPPSQFRGSGSTGPHDGLVLDAPAQTGKDLGCIGAQDGETIDVTTASGARVTVFLTVITANGATATISRT
jgi:hypothetical protein